MTKERNQSTIMGMHSMEELVIKWQHGHLTAEQMIGQLMQHIEVLYEQLRLLERRMATTTVTVPLGTT